ncbi:DUF2726 domain-containing protein [Cupriavidus basilensis]|uniref:DUF2726 domain-containing protein n=1 Tax=Cupriavidus basilensis TaxID=68895 RepID=UPI0039F67B6F
MKALFGIAILFVIVLVVISALKAKRGGGSPTSKGFQFARKAPFMRQDEIELYDRLVMALRNAHVFPQVSMSAFVQHKGKAREARNQFSQKYVDYLVCERKTLRPLYVIELDGASHGSEKAKRRDAQKNEVLASAGIPIKRYTSKNVDFTVILSDYVSVVAPVAPGSRVSEPVRDAA